MTQLAHRRHDISDSIWALLMPHLPGQKGQWGGVAKDNRLFINAVFWILRSGAAWRDKGVWERLLETLIDDPDYEWLMIDATHVKVHAHGTGAVGGNQNMGLTKGGSTPRFIWPWMRMVCRSEYLLHRVPQRIVPKGLA